MSHPSRENAEAKFVDTEVLGHFRLYAFGRTGEYAIPVLHRGNIVRESELVRDYGDSFLESSNDGGV